MGKLLEYFKEIKEEDKIRIETFNEFKKDYESKVDLIFNNIVKSLREVKNYIYTSIKDRYELDLYVHNFNYEIKIKASDIEKLHLDYNFNIYEIEFGNYHKLVYLRHDPDKIWYVKDLICDDMNQPFSKEWLENYIIDRIEELRNKNINCRQINNILLY